jgi:CheY-like chemotaxis protein
MLRRLIGEDIDLSIVTAGESTTVLADQGQIEQVILNLVVNARDAMPGGGQITLETALVAFDEAYVADHEPAVPGRYAMIAVTDTGIGMDAETRSHLFEPFFTTKERGKGTGLGLSTCYGIVKQSGGYIWVYSEPGRGSIFKVYLPRRSSAAGEQGVPVETAGDGGTETILLVEDDEVLRAAIARILSTHGYRILTARDGVEALELATRHTEPLDLVVTDVVMPGLNGIELLRKVEIVHPEARRLLMSGYTEHAVLEDVTVRAGARFLQKPFTPEALCRKVRSLLDGGRTTNLGPPPAG